MISYEDAKKVLRGSKSYSFDGEVLTINSYYKSGEVIIDFSKMTPEIFEALAKKTPEEAIYERCQNEIEGWGAKVAAAIEKIGRTRTPLSHADFSLYSAIEDQIENYCWDEGEDIEVIGVNPEDVLYHM